MKYNPRIAKIAVRSSLAVLAVTAFALLAVRFIHFTNSHTINFRSPFQSPVQITPHITDSLIIQKADAETKLSDQNIQDVPSIVDGIYGLESTYGKNDSCKKTGQFNGYGFGQFNSGGNVQHLCFPTLQAVQSAVAGFFTEKFQLGWTLDQTLCFYNTGQSAVDVCQYSKNYHILNDR